MISYKRLRALLPTSLADEVSIKFRTANSWPKLAMTFGRIVHLLHWEKNVFNFGLT